MARGSLLLLDLLLGKFKALRDSVYMGLRGRRIICAEDGKERTISAKTPQHGRRI